MSTPPGFLAFLTTALVLLLIPGPAVLFIVTRSLTQGRRAGLVSVLGISTGGLVHLAAATLGLSAILIASRTAFDIVKALGAAYLIYLGVRSILTRDGATAVGSRETRPLHRLYAEGFVVCITNPKTALFFMAFLPQFIDRAPGASAVGAQVLRLGLCFLVLALCTDSAYALLAGTARRWIVPRAQSSRWPRYASGMIYIGLGVGTALTGRQRIA